MRKSLMSLRVSRSVTAFTACSLFAISLMACPTGNWDGTAGTQQNLVPCSQSTTVFDVPQGAQVFYDPGLLPSGLYQASNFEVYVENTIRNSAGSVNISKVQTIESYGVPGAIGSGSLSVRCRENAGAFFAYDTDVTVPVQMTHTSNGNFDVDYRVLSLAYANSSRVDATASSTPMNRGMSPSAFVGELTRYWNGGYSWVRRGSNVFEFQGRRSEGTRSISAKAAYLRKDL